MIDWTDPDCSVSKYFKVREAIWLPSWGRLADGSDGLTTSVQQALTDFLSNFMDPVREFLGAPIHVHCCYRPPAYNQLVGGAPNSAHMALDGYAAIDFDIGESCDLTRAKLLPELQPRKIRMENRPGSNWVHLDCKPIIPGGNRFFRP